MDKEEKGISLEDGFSTESRPALLEEEALEPNDDAHALASPLQEEPVESVEERKMEEPATTVEAEEQNPLEAGVQEDEPVASEEPPYENLRPNEDDAPRQVVKAETAEILKDLEPPQVGGDKDAPVAPASDEDEENIVSFYMQVLQRLQDAGDLGIDAVAKAHITEAIGSGRFQNGGHIGVWPAGVDMCSCGIF